ncbi:YegP family protein [Humitalea sp. 24SJ18S-53]|uniref:YegP family protein n=1 Tax=Humitalea sp. 24SJ18S-53 TaxID=3422307 RepID=UPI003D6657E0
MKTDSLFYEKYNDPAGDFRWRLCGGNGEIVASGEGYRNEADCDNAIAGVKASGPAPVRDLTDRRQWATPGGLAGLLAAGIPERTRQSLLLSDTMRAALGVPLPTGRGLLDTAQARPAAPLYPITKPAVRK